MEDYFNAEKSLQEHFYELPLYEQCILKKSIFGVFTVLNVACCVNLRSIESRFALFAQALRKETTMKTLAQLDHLDARLEAVRTAVVEQSKRLRAIRPQFVAETAAISLWLIDLLKDRVSDAERRLEEYNNDPRSLAKYDRVVDALNAVSTRLQLSRALESLLSDH